MYIIWMTAIKRTHTNDEEENKYGRNDKRNTKTF